MFRFVSLEAVTKRAFIIATILSVAVVIGFISLSAWQKGRQLEEAQGQLAELRKTAEENQLRGEQLKEELDQSKAAMEELQREKETVTKAQKSLEQEMRSALESKEITISQLQGRLTVNILDHILYDSGEAVLKPEGEGVLQKIGGILEQYPKRQIHVIGHTDNIPIRASARDRFPSNWELSTARATAAVRFLQEKGGVDPRRLGAVGYGEFHPIADNSSSEGRAKNRRIALVVLPEVLSGADLLQLPGAPQAGGRIVSPEAPATNSPSAREQ
jgi:chemotaxis protein MotB